MSIRGHHGLLLGAGGSVEFLAATATGYVNGATSINSPSTPAGIKDGDGLFACLYARSALTPPAGWSLVKSQTNTATVTQTLYVYRKDSTASADSGQAFTWAQAASGRMGLHYTLVRSSTGAISVDESDSSTNDESGVATPTTPAAIPVLTADGSGELFLMCATAAVATFGSGDGDTWSPSSGATLRSTAFAEDNRLAVQTQARNAGQSNSTPMTKASTLGAQDNSFSGITVRLAP